jgi:hypothetical protein
MSAEPRVDFFFTATAWDGTPHIREPHKCTELAHILWGSPLLRLRFLLIAAFFLWWLWRNRCCERDVGGRDHASRGCRRAKRGFVKSCTALRVNPSGSLGGRPSFCACSPGSAVVWLLDEGGQVDGRG